MVQSKQNNRKTGDLGEQIAANYLQRKGYLILERNYWRKWGELDIVARRDEKIHFVEVKTVSYETIERLKYAVSHETWRPEEQVHQFKLHQIHKAIETWLSDRQYDGEWQIDVVAVRVVPRETYATAKHIENIVES